MNRKSLFTLSTIGCVLLLCLVVASALFIFLMNRNKPTFTLYRERGEVSYKSAGSNSYEEMTEDEKKLPYGSFVKTGDGYAHIVFDDNSMSSIDQNTEIQVNFEDDGTKIEQLAGNTWHRIKNITEGEDYTVETSTTVATVRGTRFGVMIDEYSSSILAGRGELEIGRIVMEDGEEVYKDMQTLKAGKMATLYEGSEEFVIQDIPEEKLDSTWYKRNVIIDEKFDHYELEDFIDELRASDVLEEDVYDHGENHIDQSQEDDENIHGESDETTPAESDSDMSSDDEETVDEEEETSVEELRTYFKENYNITVVEYEGCQNVNTAEFQKKLQDYLNHEADFTAEDEALASYLSMLDSYCAEDGKLDNYELEDLRLLYEEVEAGGSVG